MTRLGRGAVEIRDFRPSDAQAVRELALKCWRHAYAGIHSEAEIVETVASFYSDAVNEATLRAMSEGNTRYQVLVLGGLVAGYQTSTIGGGAELRRLYVDPPLIGRGYGKALLDAAEAYFRSRGASRYTVKVHRNNSLGIGFYERQGFQKIGSEDTELVYEKTLR